MLELRPVCENCNKLLPPDAVDARICSYECTFCEACVLRVLYNVCPNCGGGFAPRPVRPRNKLLSDPASTLQKFKPADPTRLETLQKKYGHIPPEKR